MASPFSSWRLYLQVKTDFNPSATVSAKNSDQRLLGSCKFEYERGSIIGHDWRKDRVEGLKLLNLSLATITGPDLRSYPKNMTNDVQYAINKCESSGLRETIAPSRKSIGNCTGFLAAHGSPSTSFFAEYAL